VHNQYVLEERSDGWYQMLMYGPNHWKGPYPTLKACVASIAEETENFLIEMYEANYKETPP
jgi:hypothetical protein